MNTELLRQEFEELLEKKNFNYSDKEVVEFALMLEKQLFKAHQRKDV